MKTSAEILGLLRGHTAQEPITFEDLRLKSGLAADELQQLLDTLQTFPAAVARCRHWVAGVWHDKYWPTGVIRSFNGDPKGARAYLNSLTRAPRRDELKPAAPKLEELIMQTATVQRMSPMSKVQKAPVSTAIVTLEDVLAEVALHPGIAKKKLIEKFTLEDGSNRKSLVKIISNAVFRDVLLVDPDDTVHLTVKGKAKLEGQIVANQTNEDVGPNQNAGLTQQADTKPKVLLMLEYIERYPNCQGKMLRKAANAPTVDSYLTGYLGRGEVIKEIHGPRDARYRLAKGLTAESIYTAPRGNRGKHNQNAPQAGLASSQSERAVEPAAQLKKPEGVDRQASPGSEQENEPVAGNPSEAPAAKPSLFDVDLACGPDSHVEIPAFLLKKNQPKTHRYDAPSQFKLAVTSERTIVMYGLAEEPIELTAEQTELLIDFCDGASMLLPLPHPSEVEL